MLLKWFPWKLLIRYFAISKGFLDPVLLLSKFNRFAQPSEIWAPVELLRAGAVLHARGLINSQVVQHNLDWVWPYWIERQFDPADLSFIPRAFSLTQINLTHRNWTAAGIPGFEEFVVVDPNGLVMPFFDSWSLDFWVILQNGTKLLPSRLQKVAQSVDYCNNLKISTQVQSEGILLSSHVQTILKNGIPACRIDIAAAVPEKGYLVVALRPYNTEGISFLHHIQLVSSLKAWRVENSRIIFFDRKPDLYRFSCYRTGDVCNRILSDVVSEQRSIHCESGMATAVVAYAANPSRQCETTLFIPLEKKRKIKQIFSISKNASEVWKEARRGSSILKLPYKNFQFLFDSALTTVLLHTPRESLAGPFTYKRFWFRDAAFIIYALFCTGHLDRAERIINTFFKKQTRDGYFLSQDGEWDSNGEVLWVMQRFCQFSGRKPPLVWKDSIIRAALWICRKKESNRHNGVAKGLLPAGFSAEHLGPNDYYYWDNFWGVAGLKAASWMLKLLGDEKKSEYFKSEATVFFDCIDQSLDKVTAKLSKPLMPASPFRRPDSGAVGSLAGGYPLFLLKPEDKRLIATAGYLFDHCLIDNAFYHDISHSGINPYLTLHIAEVLLRAGDGRYWDLINGIAKLASPTGQWPEAIHPQLKSGCMGDGQHVWAAAEWIIIIRNCFVLEEYENNSIILCAGIHQDILYASDKISFGPLLTSFGTVSIELTRQDDSCKLTWSGEWHPGMEPLVQIAFPGRERIVAEPSRCSFEITLPGNKQ